MASATAGVRSDAFVFFGATGDLAYKKIFPALQALARRGKLDFPVVGVAKSSWSQRSADCPRARLGHASTAAKTRTRLRRWSARLRYVDGDYNEPATFAQLRTELDGCARPAHYLAIPPSMFPARDRATGRGGLRRERAGHCREAVRTRPGLCPGAQPHPARGLCREVDLPHRSLPRQGGGAEHPVFPLRQRVSRAGVESELRRKRADHDGRDASASRAAESSTTRPASFAT